MSNLEAQCSSTNLKTGFAPKGKEIIEYYLRQLEEEGITFVPRWTPPAAAPSLETSLSCKKPAASLTVVVPDPTLKEGLSGEPLSTPSGAAEPTAGTPDGESARGLILRARLQADLEPLPLGTHSYDTNKDGSYHCPLASGLHNTFILFFS